MSLIIEINSLGENGGTIHKIPSKLVSKLCLGQLMSYWSFKSGENVRAYNASTLKFQEIAIAFTWCKWFLLNSVQQKHHLCIGWMECLMYLVVLGVDCNCITILNTGTQGKPKTNFRLLYKKKLKYKLSDSSVWTFPVEKSSSCIITLYLQIKN